MKTRRLLYLILAHSDPSTVASTIARLACPSSSFLIHVNREWDLAPFREMESKSVGLVIDRQEVKWGTVSLWKAIVVGLSEAMARADCERIVLLSQNCVPLVPPIEMESFFSRNVDVEFIGVRPMRGYGVDGWRLSHSMKRTFIPRWFSHSPLGRFQRHLGVALPALDWKRGLRGRQPQRGCLWWALTRSASEFLLKEYLEDETLRTYADELFGPEEIVPHTLLSNSKFRDRIVHHLTYERWRRGRPSPDWLTQSDLDELVANGRMWNDAYGRGEALFARKVKAGTK